MATTKANTTCSREFPFLTEGQLNNLSRLAYEIELKVEITREGAAFLLAVNGVELKEKTQLV